MSACLASRWHHCGADRLLVLLPGAYMTAEHYVENGFFSAVDQRALKLDLLAVELDLDAVASGNASQAIVEQILRPTRSDYRQVWLGGISLGGLLALCLNADHPGIVDGLCLIAPYPGSRLTTNAINQAGGLDCWRASTEQLGDPEFRAYQWLKEPPPGFPVFVGYGSEDRFAPGMRNIAERFPATSRHTLPGGHDWPVWQLLWEHFLDLGHFAT